MDDTERKLKEMQGSRVVTAPGAYYYAPAGPSSARKGFALYDAQGFYLAETVTAKPSGLTPHTKAHPRIKARIVADAPKRKPRG